MQMIILKLEQYIGGTQDQYDSYRINPLVYRQIYQSQGHRSLYRHINGCDRSVRNLQLIGHKLESMLPVRLEDILLQHQSVQDGQYGIDSIDNEQHDPKHVLGLYYKRKDHEHNGKGDGHSTDVACEASGSLPEIEEAEDRKAHHQNHDEIHIDEVELMIDNGQSSQNH